MDFLSISKIARSGMDYERNRVELASRRLSVANTGFSSIGDAANASAGVSNNSFSNYLPPNQRTMKIKTVHDPSHPSANASGDVFYLDIDPIHEMATLVSALRSYEANIRAYNTGSEMNQAALAIGSNQ